MIRDEGGGLCDDRSDSPEAHHCGPRDLRRKNLTAHSLIEYDSSRMARAALTRLTGNYQVTVPKDARDALGLKLGDILEAKVERGAVVFRPKVLRDRDEFLKEL